MELDKRTLRMNFERAAATYDGAAVLQREGAERMRSRLDVVKITPGLVLDVGSGTGHCARLLARRYRGARVFGIDISHAMAHRARRKQGWFGRPRFVCADAEELPFADGIFHLVYSVDVIHHVASHLELHREAYRVLRPGGLFLTVTDSEWIVRNRRPLSHYFP